MQGKRLAVSSGIGYNEQSAVNELETAYGLQLTAYRSPLITFTKAPR